MLICSRRIDFRLHRRFLANPYAGNITGFYCSSKEFNKNEYYTANMLKGSTSKHVCCAPANKLPPVDSFWRVDLHHTNYLLQ